MKQEYESALWELEPASGWKGEAGENCVDFYAECGVGALQVSAFSKDGAVTDADLNEFAQDELVDSVAQNVAYGAFVGLAISHLIEERFWRKMWLRSGSLLLYITYNCRLEDRAVEVEALDEMLRSLKSLVSTEA